MYTTQSEVSHAKVGVIEGSKFNLRHNAKDLKSSEVNSIIVPPGTNMLSKSEQRSLLDKAIKQFQPLF